MSNTLIFVGRLTKEAERKSFNAGSILKFSVAETVGFSEKNKSTNFWNCTVFGKQAESSLIDYLSKGAQVQIVGEVKFREYEGKTYNEVSVSRVELVGSRSDSQSAPKPQQQAPQGYAKNPINNASQDSDELPF